MARGAIIAFTLLLPGCSAGWDQDPSLPDDGTQEAPGGGGGGGDRNLSGLANGPNGPGEGDDDTVEGGGAPDGPLGWIGSPCEDVTDCPYEGAVCLRDGYPGGMCSLACDLYCPDADGYPVTFCVDRDELPASGAALGDGACHSRCDFLHHPDTGCRGGFGCVPVPRANEADGWTYACLPEREAELPDCYLDLAARGVAFEPTILADDHPEDHPELTCHVEDALYLFPDVWGVQLRYYYDSEPDRVTVNCETAHAIADTVADVGPLGVVEVVHVGTYNCRTISGTSTLSQHGLGNALDIHGFTFEDGAYVSVYAHWEDGDETPETWEGQFLHDAVHRWYDAWIWNVILTPEYNDAHDDHLHVDLTEGSHGLYLLGDRYLGPAPYDD